MNLKYNIPVMFEKINDVSVSDSRFTKVKVWLMHTGQNHNASSFEKDVVDEALPSLEYIPIVGFIENNSTGEEDFSDHRYTLSKKDGELTRVYQGSAYGVILNSSDNNAHFEKRLCDDGIEREYLVVDGIIWNQFSEGSDIMNRDFVKNQSMELAEDSVEGYEDEDNIFHFTKFSFKAACILGFDQSPAMQNSTVEVQFTMSDFVKNIQSELSNKIAVYTDFVKQQEEKKEGEKEMPKPKDFSLIVLEQFSEIRNIISAFAKVKDYWGDEVPQYYVQDVQENEVIVVDRTDNYNYYAFKFTSDGDKPNIDFSSKVRKKTQYVDYVEGSSVELEGSFSFATHISEFEKTVTEKIETANKDKQKAESDYSTVKSEYDEIKPKYEEFVKAEETRIENETLEKKNELFTQFDAHLSDLDDYVKLKENLNDYSLDDLKGKCALMFTEKSLDATNFSKKKDKHLSADLPDTNSEDNENVVETKYGFIKVSKK